MKRPLNGERANTSDLSDGWRYMNGILLGGIIVFVGFIFGEIAEKFRLTGFLPDKDLPFYYNVADFFVLPSKSGEGSPLVILEAMASGLPVIATKVGGIPEVMIEGLGSIVPPDDPQALADAIVDLSRQKLAQLKEELRGRIKEKQADILAVSMTMDVHRSEMESLVEKIRKPANDLPSIKIMVGGYAFLNDPELWKKIGADGSASNATEAVRLANKFMG